MKVRTYAIVIAVLIAAAFLRMYAPKDQEITYLASSGIQRGIAPVNIAGFWLLITIAAAYVLRRII